jgi:uncharacterized protein (TIGR03118 family)
MHLAVSIRITTSLFLIMGLAMSPVAHTHFAQLNLVSDVAGFALYTDPNLVNAWGLVLNRNGSVQVANNGTGTSTAYFKDGEQYPSSVSPLIINIPGPENIGTGTPTGIALNKSSVFSVTKNALTQPATYLFATEDGTIAAFNANVDPTNAILVKDNSSSLAVYKGIALAKDGLDWFLYVTNFHTNAIEKYDSSFNLVESFTDVNVDVAGFAPFGIRTIDDKLYVTYAKQDIAKHDDVSGAGNGFVDVFSPSGALIKRLISQGNLNSPWGLAVAPYGFGALGGALLVGNFGDGKINAYRLPDGQFIEQLKNIQGSPLTINGLWGLEPYFGDYEHNNDEHKIATIFFAAGAGDEVHGLFGKIKFAE